MVTKKNQTQSYLNHLVIYGYQHFVFEVQPPTLTDIYLYRHLKILVYLAAIRNEGTLHQCIFLMPVKAFLTALGPLKK
jgi:hypothetical protein